MNFFILKNKFFFFPLLLSFFIFLPPLLGGRGESEGREEALRGSSIRHLSTPEDHANFLKEALGSAQRTVVILTYTIDFAFVASSPLKEAFRDAFARGLNIYIYYQTVASEGEGQERDFKSRCRRFAESPTHAKCVLRDDRCVAIGSYDWLSGFRGGLNGSWVVEGDVVRAIGERIWEGVRFHQSIAYENQGGQGRFFNNRDNFRSQSVELAPGEILYSMGTPEAHDHFLKETVLRSARREIILCSPFIRFERLQEVFSRARLQDLERRHVRLVLITQPDPCSRTPHEKEPIFRFLAHLCHHCPNFSYALQEGLHAKSIIVDDALLLEGSFNILSAVASSLHDANNQEMSLALQGNIARRTIERMRQDPQWRNLYLNPGGLPSQANKRTSEDSLRAPKRTASHPPLASQRPGRIEVFSGERCGRRGYCARIDGQDYVVDKGGRTAYFPTPDGARRAAIEVLEDKSEDTDESSSDDSFSS